MMTSKADAWMPLDVGAYTRDTGHLTTIEHGAYFLLLMSGWVRGGALPVEEDRLRAITKMDPKDWKRSRLALMEFFRLDGDAYRQKRLDAELTKAGIITRQRSVAGKASAQARKRQQKSNENPTAVERDGQRKPNEASTELPTEGQQTFNETADLYKEDQETKKEAKQPLDSVNPREEINGHDPRNCVENGREVVGGFYFDEVWPRIFAATGIDPTKFLGTEIEARKWLRDGIEPETIIARIERAVARPNYRPKTSLGYFDPIVRDTRKP